MELDDITGAIVDAAMKIHVELGPGLLESVYEVILARALEQRGFQVERQKNPLSEVQAHAETRRARRLGHGMGI